MVWDIVFDPLLPPWMIAVVSGVAALPRAPDLERLALVPNLVDGGPNLRVGGTFAVENDSDGLH